MEGTHGEALAGLMGLTYMEKGGPFLGRGAVGEKQGFPLAVDWTKRKRQQCVAFIVSFRKGTLNGLPEAVLADLLLDKALLEAMGKKKVPQGGAKASVAKENRITLYWDYSLRAPKPEAVAAAAEAIVRFMGGHSDPVGEGCSLCGSSSGGMLYCLELAPVMLCGSCAEGVRADNMNKERAWDAVEPRLVSGILAGALVALLAALAWGGLAYSTHKMYGLLALVIGFCVAKAVKFGMGKVTLAGKVATFVLTVASVVAGQFFFIVLAVAKSAKVHVSLELARRVMPHFIEIQFSHSSGYISVLYGLLGAVIATVYLKQKTPGRELVLVQQSGASAAMG